MKKEIVDTGILLKVLSCDNLGKIWSYGDQFPVTCTKPGNSNAPHSYSICINCEYLPKSIKEDAQEKLDRLLHPY
jgi:hypothetical protein